MAKDANVEATIHGFATMLKAANLEKIGTDLVGAFTTMVSMYRALKADTEVERAARVQEFAAALRELRALVNQRIDDLRGVDGMHGRDGKDGAKGEVGVRGLDGYKGERGEKGKDGVDGSPDSADDIRNKLELLTGKDRLNVSAIDGLTELLAEFDTKIGGVRSSQNRGGMAVTGRDIFNDIDLSAQLDGVTTTFQIHAVYNIISVHLSSFPHALRKNIDFTYTPTTITFTSQIDAATTLSAGQTCVLTVVNA